MNYVENPRFGEEMTRFFTCFPLNFINTIYLCILPLS